MQADIPLGAGVIFVIVSPLVNDKCLLAVQIGAVDTAYQSIRQQETAVLNRGQNGNGGAELSIRCGIGQLEVQCADLYAADTVYSSVTAYDGNT